MERTWIGMAVVLGVALAASHVAAQKMYRCGNTFQDRPCAAVPPAQPAAAAPAPTAAAPAATQPVQRSASAREAQRRQDFCESLSMQLEDVRGRQQAGGSGASAESLARQQREIEGKLAASRC